MNKKYHLWTEGCQMNVADSQRVGSSLEHLGYIFTDKAEEAESLEKLQQRYALLGESLKDLKEKIKQTEAEMEKSKLTKECEQIELRRERLLEYIKNRKEENKK